MIVEETERSSKETSWRWDAVAPKAMRAARQKRKKRRMSCDKDYKKMGKKAEEYRRRLKKKKKARMRWDRREGDKVGEKDGAEKEGNWKRGDT